MTIRKKQLGNENIAQFRDRLWDVYRDSVSKLTSREAIAVLRVASNTVWKAGLDQAFYRVDNGSEVLADVFDIAWLSVAIVMSGEVAKPPLTKN